MQVLAAEPPKQTPRITKIVDGSSRINLARIRYYRDRQARTHC